MSKKTLWMVIIGVAILFFAAGYAFPSFNKSGTLIPNNNYQAGWDAAKKRMSDGGFYPASSSEVKSVTGEIKDISNGKITLKIRPLDLLADPVLDERIITIDSTTKIFSQEPKDQKEFFAEMTEYDKQLKNNQAKAATVTTGTSTAPIEIATLTPPNGFIKTEIALSDLKVGQTVSVMADKNIKEVKEFNAIEINFYKPLISTITPMTPQAPAISSTPASAAVK